MKIAHPPGTFVLQYEFIHSVLYPSSSSAIMWLLLDNPDSALVRSPVWCD